MIKTVSRAFLAALFAAVIFASFAAVTSPAFWDIAKGWAQSSTSAASQPKIVLPKAARDYLKQHASSDAGSEPDQTSARGENIGPEPAAKPATDDAIAVTTMEETIQDGTTSQWDGAGGNYQVPRYVTRKFLKVTSKADEIAVTSIEINRGNCEPMTLEESWKPHSLKFGESTSVWIMCDPIEAKIGTDRGIYTFTW